MDASEIRLLASVEETHWWYTARRRLLLDYMCAIRPGGVSLDVGSAGGAHARLLNQHGFPAVAIERSAEGVHLCRSRGVPVLHGDALHLPVRSRSVSTVLLLDVIEHLADAPKALSEARRATSPNGSLVVSVPADQRLWSQHDVAVGHVKRYEMRELLAEVEEAGWRIESSRYWNSLLKPAIRLRRWLGSNTGSDLQQPSRLPNRVLEVVVDAERRLQSLGRLPGVSIWVVGRTK